MNQLFGLTRAPRHILFGNGQRHAAGRLAASIGKRVLVCTDERFGASPDMSHLLQTFKDNGIEARVYDRTEPDLPVGNGYACVAQHKNFQPNVVIGVGGGSCLDMAKLASLLLAHDGDASRYYGENQVPGPTVPVIAMPTTSGTGSEATPVAVLSDDSRGLKIGISSAHLIPHASICDPELTLTCPPGLTAVAGADAMTHAIEAFTAIRRTPDANLAQDRVFVGKNLFSDHYALLALEALARYLPQAVENGSDIQARSQVMLGALMAGLAFGTAGTAAAHAIQYPVGALTHTAHGAGVATLMPYVMHFNIDACQAEYAAIARAMGAEGTDETTLAREAPVRVARLFADIGIPTTLAQLGVKPDHLTPIVEQSLLAKRLVDNNPRALDAAAIQSIVSHAFDGRL